MIKNFCISIAVLSLLAPLSGVAAERAHQEGIFLAPSEVHSCGTTATAAPAPSPAIPLSSGPVLTIEVRDASTQGQMAARVGVWSGGSSVVPPDPEAALYQSVMAQSHFYCDGQISLTVPAGEVTIKVGRGFEYAPRETTLTVDVDMTVVVALDRLVDMNKAGWHAADTHAHISHPPVLYNVQPEQVIMVMEAEGLNMVNSMEEEPYFTGAKHPASTTNRNLYFSKEERNAHFGHMTLVGLKQWIPDQTCDVLTHVCGRTLTRQIADAVHAQDVNTMVIATHPFPDYYLNNIAPWPGGGIWRGMTLDLLGGHVDAMDILNYTHDSPPTGIDDYFHALNLGIRIPPSAGSDAVLGTGASLPVGGYRVYAQIGRSRFRFNRWVDAMKNGRTFVSNYPLITEFDVGGKEPGDELAYTGSPLSAHIAVTCARPFDTIEIIAGGVVVHQIDVAPGTTNYEATFDVDPPAGAGWIVARVSGDSGGWHVVDANGLFAQTAPIYVSNSDPIGFAPVGEAAARYLDFTQSVAYIFRYAEFTPEGRAEFDSMTANALDFYSGVWPDPPSSFELLSPLNISFPHGQTWVRNLTPTFRWQRSIDPDPSDSVTYEFQLDEDSTFANPQVATGLIDSVFTVPPEYGLEDQHVYYWRVIAVDDTGNRQTAAPELWSFVIDMVAVGVDDASPPAWALRSAYPNPFNPTLRVSYAVPVGGEAHHVAVYDARGRHVHSLFRGSRPAGVYEALWNGRDNTGAEAASGVYFVRLSAGANTAITRKVVLLK